MISARLTYDGGHFSDRYFTEGIFVALLGETYTAAEKASVYRRFPEWSPQRHMFLDAPQRQAVRDLLGLAAALDSTGPGGLRGVMVMPKLWCHCDRYISRSRLTYDLGEVDL
jgi:hypothetical protein